MLWETRRWSAAGCVPRWSAGTISKPLGFVAILGILALVGMIPIAPTVFWGSMAYAIRVGLAVASLLTLVFLPTLYVTWFGGKAPHVASTSPGEPHAT